MVLPVGNVDAVHSALHASAHSKAFINCPILDPEWDSCLSVLFEDNQQDYSSLESRQRALHLKNFGLIQPWFAKT